MDADPPGPASDGTPPPVSDESSAPAKRPNPMRGRVASAGDTPVSTGNVANIITVVRIMLAPLFLVLLLVDGGEFGPLRYVATVLFVVAIATDGVDGYLARRRNLVTDVGIILDPIADKVLIAGALVALSILGEVWWWVTILVLVREFGITAMRFAVLRSRVIPASIGGKLKTWLQAVAVTAFLLAPWRLLGDWAFWVCAVLLGIAVAVTVVTGVDYVVKAWRLNRGGK